MAFRTLDVVADAGGDKSPSFRSSTTEYSDGYKQVVYAGRHKKFDVVTFTFSGDIDETLPVYELLVDTVLDDVPFYYRFNGTDAAKLYKAKNDTIKHSHVSGLKWSVSATFEEWSGL